MYFCTQLHNNLFPSSESDSTLSVCSINPKDYPGVVFSKEETKMKLTHDGGNIRGEGIHIYVPPGAIDINDCIEISLLACVGGPFHPPEGLQFVSPVYLIQQHYVFHKNVTLSLEVFSELDLEEDRRHLVFVTSSYRHDAIDKEARLMFKLHEGELSFDVEMKIVTMEIKHGCFFGIAGTYS